LNQNRFPPRLIGCFVALRVALEAAPEAARGFLFTSLSSSLEEGDEGLGFLVGRGGGDSETESMEGGSADCEAGPGGQMGFNKLPDEGLKTGEASAEVTMCG